LRLGFARRGDATILRRCRYTLPLQVLSSLALDDGTCYLLLLNPTGGVLGGDRLHSEIALEEGARVCLSTPSATRVYRSSGAPAEMQAVLRVGRNATLEYFPDHVIPHAGSALHQSLRIEMEEGSRGIFFDGFAAGRIALGERWMFRDFDSRTDIFLHGQPIFANRARILGTSSPHLPQVVIPSDRRDSRDLSSSSPAANHNLPFRGSELQLRHSTAASLGALAPEEHSSIARSSQNSGPSSLGRMAGYAYSGSMLIVANKFDNWRELLEKLRAELESIPNFFGGASLLAHSGCCVRYLAQSAIEFHAATERLRTLARRHLLGLPPLALRKY
jgi:urease accessory protein UreH